MEVKEVMIHGDYAAFWGGVFSNWYPCKFKAYGKTWYSSEQFFMWLKAEYFDDEETALAITKTMSASVAKQLGREVKNFDETKWQAVRYEKMYEAVYKKFAQNEELLQDLLSDEYKDKHFVEGSPVDTIWGIGIKWTKPIIADKNNWKGENLLGQVLDEVRERVKKE